MKTDGKLGRNYLLGELGDKINALLCSAGHDIRLILKKLRERLFLLFARLLLALFSCSDWQENGAWVSGLTEWKKDFPRPTN